MMRVHLMLLGISCFIFACSDTKEIHSYVVTKYQKVGKGYHYSKDMFEYFKDTYKPLVSAEYDSDTLLSVFVYKSEGKIKYDKNELKIDSLFMLTLKLPESIKLRLNGTKLIDNDKIYEVVESKDDSIFCKIDDTLILYLVKRGNG